MTHLTTFRMQISQMDHDVNASKWSGSSASVESFSNKLCSSSRPSSNDGIWQDTLSRDTSGILRKMISIGTAPETPAPLAHIHRNLIVNGRPCFDLLITNDELGLSAYRIGFWLEEDDVISIFASFPDGIGIEDEIMALANSINVKKSCV